MLTSNDILIFCGAEWKKLMRRGQNHYTCGHVKVVTVGKDGVVSASVRSSFKSTMRSVSITLSSSGNYRTIENANCSCALGRSKCSHMVALLLHIKEKLSCTDFPCKWSERKPPQNTSTKSIAELSSSKKKTVIITTKKTVEDIRQQCLTLIRKRNIPVGYTWLLGPEVDEPKDQQLSPKLDLELILKSNQFHVSENKFEFLREHVSLQDKEIEEIANKSIGQFSNQFYCAIRRYRLTASNFGPIIRAINRNRFPPSLFKTLAGQRNLNSVKAIHWGRTHEKTAKDFARDQLKLSFTESGLFLHSSGLLGASPDGISDEFTVEVKCPYKFKDIPVEQGLLSTKDYIIRLEADGKCIINKKHDYYHQIQAQLHFSKRAFCYIVIWTVKSCFVAKIHRCEEWAGNIPRIIDFYVNHFIPYLLNNV